MENLEYSLREFISKRCEHILLGSETGAKKSNEILKKLIKELNDAEKEMLIEYSDEISAEYSRIEEDLYYGGFFDGMFLALRYFTKKAL